VNIVAPGILYISEAYIELIAGDINDQFRQETAYCLNAWLNAAGVSEGLVWRGIEKHALSTGLSAQTISRIVTRRFSQAGLRGINPRSLRAGFMATAAEQQLPCLILLALCGARSSSKFGRYVPAGSAIQRFLADGAVPRTALMLKHKPQREDSR
jgi:hypothetical protein